MTEGFSCSGESMMRGGSWTTLKEAVSLFSREEPLTAAEPSAEADIWTGASRLFSYDESMIRGKNLNLSCSFFALAMT